MNENSSSRRPRAFGLMRDHALVLKSLALLASENASSNHSPAIHWLLMATSPEDCQNTPHLPTRPESHGC